MCLLFQQFLLISAKQHGLDTHKKHFPATQNACHKRGREHNQRNLYAYPTQTEQRFIVMFVCNGNKNDQTKKTCSRIGRNSCQSFLTLIGGDSMCRIQPSRLRDRLNKKSTYQRTGHVRGGNKGGSTLPPFELDNKMATTQHRCLPSIFNNCTTCWCWLEF